jgi:hypothetical protein
MTYQPPQLIHGIDLVTYWGETESFKKFWEFDSKVERLDFK